MSHIVVSSGDPQNTVVTEVENQVTIITGDPDTIIVQEQETQVIEVIQQGPQGPQGPVGEGVAAGGTTGQILEKASNTDYDTQWVDPPTSAEWGSITGTLSDQTDLQTALDAKADDADLTSHVSNTSNPHSVTATQLGLGNVDNTSDLNKPISTATQTALDLKADTDLQNIAPTGDVDMNTQKIVNVVDPTLAQDAATKNYVDTEIAAIPAPTTPNLQEVTDAGATTTNTVTLSPSGNNDGLVANGSGSGRGVNITHSGSGTSLNISHSGSGSDIVVNTNELTLSNGNLTASGTFTGNKFQTTDTTVFSATSGTNVVRLADRNYLTRTTFSSGYSCLFIGNTYVPSATENPQYSSIFTGDSTANPLFINCYRQGINLSPNSQFTGVFNQTFTLRYDFSYIKSKLWFNCNINVDGALFSIGPAFYGDNYTSVFDFYDFTFSSQLWNNTGVGSTTPSGPDPLVYQNEAMLLLWHDRIANIKYYVPLYRDITAGSGSAS